MKDADAYDLTLQPCVVSGKQNGLVVNDMYVFILWRHDNFCQCRLTEDALPPRQLALRRHHDNTH